MGAASATRTQTSSSPESINHRITDKTNTRVKRDNASFLLPKIIHSIGKISAPTETTAIRNGRECIRIDKVKREMHQAVEALQHTGIITQYKEGKAADGGILCAFRINESWLSEEAKKLDSM